MFFERSVGLFTLFLIRLLALTACGGGDSDKAAEHYVKGTIYTTAGPWENAIKEFDESIRLDPKAADAHNNRGAVYAELDQFQKAIGDYDEGIRIEPDLSNGYHNRAIAYGDLRGWQGYRRLHRSSSVGRKQR